MSKRTKNIIVAVAAIQIMLAVAIFALPAAVEAMPSRYQAALQSRVPGAAAIFNALEGPGQANLPAPSAETEDGEAVAIVVPTLSFDLDPTAEPTLEPTAEPTAIESAAEPTAAPEDEAAPEPTVAPTAEPTAEPTTVPIATLPPPPASARVDGLINIPQGFNNCGPANMTIMLNHFGQEATQSEAASYLKPNPEDRNVSPWQMADYVNDFTILRARALSGGNTDMLKQFIANGIPVIVEKGYDPTAAEGWYGHYLTVFGYDDEARVYNAMDTYLGPFNEAGAIESYADMDELWQHFNYTFLVIYPPGKEATVDQIVGEVMLDPQLMWQNSATIAQADIEADPENAFAWFNLGTSLTRLGELSGNTDFYSSGADAFDTARTLGLPYRMLWYQHRPYIAYMRTGRYQDMLDLANATLETAGGRNVEETYFYRGHANTFLGNFGDAIEDMERALELNSNFYPAQIALDSLNG